MVPIRLYMWCTSFFKIIVYGTNSISKGHPSFNKIFLSTFKIYLILPVPLHSVHAVFVQSEPLLISHDDATPEPLQFLHFIIILG